VVAGVGRIAGMEVTGKGQITKSGRRNNVIILLDPGITIAQAQRYDNITFPNLSDIIVIIKR
jgi:hypothetical protein